MAVAEAEAKKSNWPVAIAIVFSSGNLAAFSKIDNTQHASVDIAIGKAVVDGKIVGGIGVSGVMANQDAEVAAAGAAAAK
jgi:uncharacterized protein GlcG (DUF336 family)